MRITFDTEHLNAEAVGDLIALLQSLGRDSEADSVALESDLEAEGHEDDDEDKDA